MRFPKATREKLYASAGRPVEVEWPASGPAPQPNHLYAVQSSGRASEVQVIVLAVEEAECGWKAMVRLDTDPVRMLGKAGGYSTSAAGALQTRVEPDPDSLQFRPEFEPEAVGEAEQAEITRQAHDARNLRVRARIGKAEEALSEMEGDEEFVQSASLIGYLRRRLRALEDELRRDEAVDRRAA